MLHNGVLFAKIIIRSHLDLASKLWCEHNSQYNHGTSTAILYTDYLYTSVWALQRQPMRNSYRNHDNLIIFIALLLARQRGLEWRIHAHLHLVDRLQQYFCVNFDIKYVESLDNLSFSLLHKVIQKPKM